MRRVERTSSLFKATFLTGVLMLVACTRHQAATLFPNGDDWLRWNEFEKEQYVSAYVEGISEGFRNGCEAAVEVMLPQADGQKFLDSNAQCIEHAPFSGRDLNVFVPSVTLFFQRYPEHRHQRNLGVSEVLRRLDAGKTVEQIHVEFSPRS
jgi:hypothetical protein